MMGQIVAFVHEHCCRSTAGDNAPADHTIGQRWAHFEACAGLARLAGLQESVAGLLSQLSAQADEPGAPLRGELCLSSSHSVGTRLCVLLCLMQTLFPDHLTLS